MYNIKVISARKNLIQGYSSVGRAAVSKTACRGFKSFCPCQKETVTVLVTVSFLLDKTCPRHARAGLRRRALPVADAARRGWRSGQNMAQRSKYGVTPPYFGHRKRGCEATSSPFVYHKQSCGDNYCFCFTAIGVLSE